MPTDLAPGQKACIEEDLKVGATPLHQAVQQEDTEAVKKILSSSDKKAINAATKEGKYTPLHLAAFQGNETIIGLLLEHGANVSAKSEDGATPVVVAAIAGNRNAIEKIQGFEAIIEIKEVSKKENYSALHLSIQKGDKQAAEKLLCGNSNINAKTKQGHTALHLAAIEGRAGFIKLLIQYDVQVNSLTLEKETPLLLAAFHAKPAAIRELLAGGADITITNQKGQTPLDVLRAQANLIPNDEDINHCIALMENAELKLENVRLKETVLNMQQQLQGKNSVLTVKESRLIEKNKPIENKGSLNYNKSSNKFSDAPTPTPFTLAGYTEKQKNDKHRINSTPLPQPNILQKDLSTPNKKFNPTLFGKTELTSIITEQASIAKNIQAPDNNQSEHESKTNATPTDFQSKKNMWENLSEIENNQSSYKGNTKK